MKKFILFIFHLLFYGLCCSQVPLPNNNRTSSSTSLINTNSNAAKDDIGGEGVVVTADRVLFTYDEAGNQKQRILCINCGTNRIANLNDGLTPY